MLTLVLGGAASGKSEYAEKLAAGICAAEKLYLATMRHGPSAEARISKHVKRREGLGFRTLEDPLLEMKWQAETEMPVILLEDIPNILANRMFSPQEVTDDKERRGIPEGSLPQDIAEAVLKLSTGAGELIAVSGDIFRDGTRYPELTEKFIKYLGELNCRLAEGADRVVEVVCGIPVDHKVHR